MRRVVLLCASFLTFACRPAPATDVPETQDWSASENEEFDDFEDLGEELTRPPGIILRSELNRVAAKPPAVLLQHLMPVAYRPSGRFEGWTIQQVFPREPALCGQCDLHAGDIIVSVNGNRLERPEHLTSLLEALPDISVLEVDRIREGQRQQVQYRIVEGR